jgi:hypothetical protein
MSISAEHAAGRHQAPHTALPIVCPLPGSPVTSLLQCPGHWRDGRLNCEACLCWVRSGRSAAGPQKVIHAAVHGASLRLSRVALRFWLAGVQHRLSTADDCSFSTASPSCSLPSAANAPMPRRCRNRRLGLMLELVGHRRLDDRCEWAAKETRRSGSPTMALVRAPPSASTSDGSPIISSVLQHVV